MSAPENEAHEAHEALRELSGLYALGALSDPDLARFEVHLAGCAECAAEVRALLPIVEGLARAVPVVDPPPELRERVLRSAHAPRAFWAAGDRTVQTPPPRLAWLAAAASLAAAIGLGVYAGQLRSRVIDLESRLRDATLRAAAADRQIADARRAAIEAQSTVAILAAPDLARIDLAGQSAAPAATGRAFWSRSRGLVFTASNLPVLPSGKIYQLWVVTARAPLSAGLLRPDASGRVTAVFDTSPDLPQPVAMAVTIEPEGGVPAPTGEKFLVGSPTGL